MSQIEPRKFFDYNALPDKATRATLRSEATAIKAAVKRTHDNIIEIGNRLLTAKILIEHGEFQQWIEAEFGMGYDMAWNFMNAAKRFSKIDFNQLLGLPQTAIFALARPSVDDETREVALELAASGDLKNVADVKQLIEVAKPVKPAPTALEPPVEADDDYDDSDPFDNLDLEKPDVSTPGENLESETVEVAPASPKKTAPDTLENRVKNAEVLHDTISNKSPQVELTDDQWLASLPIYRVLSQKQHRGIALRRDLISMRGLAEALNTFEHQARRAFSFKNPFGTPAETRIISAAAMPRPLDWQICAPCKGNGCGRCNHAGYDVSGAGISPLRVESSEVTL